MRYFIVNLALEIENVSSYPATEALYADSTHRLAA